MKIYIPVAEATIPLDMTKAQIYRAIRENKFPFPFVRIGKLIRIDARAIGLVDGPTSQINDARTQATAAKQEA